jgi:hypothetical protein
MPFVYFLALHRKKLSAVAPCLSASSGDFLNIALFEVLGRPLFGFHRLKSICPFAVSQSTDRPEHVALQLVRSGCEPCPPKEESCASPMMSPYSPRGRCCLSKPVSL